MHNTLVEVGDGLCLVTRQHHWCCAQIDCGSQQGGKYAAERWLRQLRSDASLWRVSSLWLTHYHSDHYNGFVWAARQGVRSPHLRSLREIYSPGLPDPPVTTPLVVALFALAAYTLGEQTGIMDVDFRRVAARLSGSPRLRHFRLFQGDEIELADGSPFQVLWPPKTLSESARASIQEAVRHFHSLLEQDKRSRLRQLYYQAKELGVQGRVDAAAEDIEPREGSEWPEVELYETDARLDPELRAVNGRLRAAANYLGLAFCSGKNFLFLGDLDPTSMREVIDLLTHSRCTRFRSIVAAHHGTVWCDELLRLHARSVVVSVGNRLWRHIVSGLGLIAPRVRFTRLEGDIAF